jgi:hypothetical protein
MGEYGQHCPSGAADITSKSDCHKAVTALGRSYSGDASNPNIPLGCVTWDDKQAVFNSPSHGAETINVARLCKQSTEDLSDEASKAADDIEVAQSLGGYMASWVRSQEGKHIDRGECWDLANEAIKHAKAAGFKVASSPSTYEWSRNKVSYRNAQPGDILQFVSYSERTAHSSKQTGSHHTAVVVKSFDSSSCGIEVEEQNPKPVHDTVYHPCSKTGGSITVYRMSSSMVDETVVDEIVVV